MQVNQAREENAELKSSRDKDEGTRTVVVGRREKSLLLT